ncbi:helix-turn-helix domain-containing protein [Maritimibacter sp. DP07]|uniref:Helix-turn-helix domain-containing protein n=1 Tax=Maritimibacter harenae TaxID=2606218 RepID=A0A845LUX4_9RHOB|nr:IclR family transcriptional regulator [Maritimibacter harenae]MZR11670.1 helix-turn-helix domain-containing protein [Maritimibacter harenae]
MKDDLLGPVVRAFRVVNAMAEAGEDLSGKQLSDQLELPPSTVHRLLQLLAKLDIVEQNPDDHKYRPGSQLLRIAFSIVRRSDVASMGDKYLRGIVDELNATCVLWMLIPEADLVVTAGVARSSHPLDFVDIAFAPRGLAWGAVGRAVLAHLPDSVVERVAQNAGPSPTGKALEPLDEFKANLAQIREQGYAFSEGHTISEAVGVAVPIFGHNGTVVACYAATLPMSRFKPAMKKKMVEVVTAGARKLSLDLGYSGTSAAAK